MNFLSQYKWRLSTASSEEAVNPDKARLAQFSTAALPSCSFIGGYDQSRRLEFACIPKLIQAFHLNIIFFFLLYTRFLLTEFSGELCTGTQLSQRIIKNSFGWCLFFCLFVCILRRQCTVACNTKSENLFFTRGEKAPDS